MITADEMMNGMTMSSMMSFMCILYHTFSFIARNYCVDYMARLRHALNRPLRVERKDVTTPLCSKLAKEGKRTLLTTKDCLAVYYQCVFHFHVLIYHSITR